MNQPWCLIFAACLGLSGCLPEQGSTRPTSTQSPTSTVDARPQAFAPLAEVTKTGQWQGGPEEMSGKLRSGIATYYRILGAPLRPQAPFDIELRFEGADADDAVVELRAGDGAQFSPAQATHRWRLTKNQPALVKLKMTAPLGDSYLHVLTVQHGRQAVRSFVLHMTRDGSQPR